MEIYKEEDESIKHIERNIKNSSSTFSREVLLARLIRFVSLVRRLQWKYIYNQLVIKISNTFSKTNLDDFISSPLHISEVRKTVIYTCITGNYDFLQEPLYTNENIEYIIVTDGEIQSTSLWKKKSIDSIIGISHLSDAAKNRYVKMHPHVLFPEFEVSVYVDGNIQVVADLIPMQIFLRQSPIALHRHSGRGCIYEESLAVLALGKGNEVLITEQMNQYKKQGFPKNFGLFENNVILRRHNNEICIEIMETWWSELLKYECRDQLSFTYVLWKLGLGADFVSNLGNNMKNNVRFKYFSHRRD